MPTRFNWIRFSLLLLILLFLSAAPARATERWKIAGQLSAGYDEIITGMWTFVGGVIFGSITVDILKLYDTDDSNTLSVIWNEDDSADRGLSLAVSGANRTLTLTGDVTGDQDVSSIGSPTFAAATVTGALSADIVKINDSDDSNLMTLQWSENDSADRTLSIEVSGGDRTIDITGNSTIDQDVSTTGSPTWTQFGDGTASVTGGAGSGFTTLSASGAVTADIVKINDSDDSNLLTLAWNEDDSSDRTLNIEVSGGTRSLDITGDAIIDQDVSTSGSPTWSSYGDGVGTCAAGSCSGFSSLSATSIDDTVATLTAGGLSDLVSLATGTLAASPAAVASGVPTDIVVTGPAHTGLTASTEVVGALFDYSATKTWATGALASQNEVKILAPTYAFAGASTLAEASTLYIDNAPQAGANATITQANAIWVDDGNVRFDGRVSIGDHGLTYIPIHGTDFNANIFSASDSLLDLTSVWISGSDTNYVAPVMYFARGRNTVLNPTIVQDDDALGSVFFSGHDGTDYNQAAIIIAEVDGTPGANDMPGRLNFYTSPDGTNAPVERMRLTQAGLMILGTGEGGVVAATGNTFRAPDVVTGGAGDIPGTDFTIGAGLGTGAGDVGQVIIQTPRVAAAGDNPQTLTTLMTLDEATVTVAGTLDATTIAATGDLAGDLLKINDTDDSNTLSFVWNENDSADRVLNLLVSGASRSLTVSGDSTIDQNVSTGGSPTWTQFGDGVMNCNAGGCSLLVSLSAATVTDTVASLNAGNFTGLLSITSGTATVDTSDWVMIRGAQTSDPRVTHRLSADANGDYSITTDTGDIDLFPGGGNVDITGTLGTSAGASHVLGAANNVAIDGSITPHTDTTGLLSVTTTTATAFVVGGYFNATLSGDVDGVTGIKSVINGLSSGASGGNTVSAMWVELNGDDNDAASGIDYIGLDVKPAVANGGGGDFIGISIGTGFDNTATSASLLIQSGPVILFNHDATIQGLTATPGAGNDLSIFAADAVGAGPSNGGSLVLAGGAAAGAGNGGPVCLDNTGTCSSDDTLDRNSLLVTSKVEVDGTARFDGAVDVNSTLEVAGSITGDSLKLFDDDDSNVLTVTWDASESSDRTLTLRTNSGSRVLTLGGDATLDQDVDTTASPSFVAMTATGDLAGDLLKINDTDDSNTLSVVWNEDDSSDRTLNLLVSGATRSLTISGDSTINQDVSTSGTPTFTSVSAGLVDLNPSGTASQDIVNITPSAAIGTNESIWNGLKIDGNALDPTSDDVILNGLHVDMSAVSASGAGMDNDGIVVKMPTIADDGILIYNGKIRQDIVIPNTVATEFTGIDIILDSSSIAATSDYHAVDVATTGTPAGDLVAVGTHLNIIPIRQLISVFSSPSQTEYAGRRITGGTVWADGIDAVEVFAVKNDEVLIGSASQFSEIEVILGTAGTRSVTPTFYYNTAADSWTQFFPADDTDGFQISGTVRWTLSSISGSWTNDGDPGGAETSAGYWIRIVRTANPDPGTPTPTTMKTGVGSTYEWEADGDLSVKDITCTGLSVSDGAIINVGDIDVDSVSADGSTVDYMDVNIFELTQEDVGATCTLGQIRFDTGGATQELCYCQATDTWVCAAMTAGPTD